MRLLIKYLIVALLIVGCEPAPQSPVTDSEESSTQNLSIAALKSLYIANSHKLTDVVFITATITANDYMGEYPDALILEDESGALEVCVDLEEELHNYPIAREVTINCTNLWLSSEGSGLVLGGEPAAGQSVTPLSLSEFRRCAKVSTAEVQPLQPRQVTLSQLSKRLLSCFLQLDGVKITSKDPNVNTFCAKDSESGRYISTRHTVEEVATGRKIDLYIPSTVEYANEPLPTGVGTLCVTLESYGGVYSVRLVSRRFYISD